MVLILMTLRLISFLRIPRLICLPFLKRRVWGSARSYCIQLLKKQLCYKIEIILRFLKITFVYLKSLSQILQIENKCYSDNDDFGGSLICDNAVYINRTNLLNIYFVMIDKLLEIQEKLKIWRAIILILTIVMLLISFIADDQMAVIVLIICFFAIILFQSKHLPSTSYQIFIILQIVYFIYLSGKLLETLYYHPFAPIWIVSKSVYFMATLLLFMVILWRHYQKDQLDLYQDDPDAQ